MATNIDPALLANLKASASYELDHFHNAEHFDSAGCNQPNVAVDANDLLKILDRLEVSQALVVDLLTENKTLKRDLKQTQYLSVLWVRILDSYVPPEMRQRAMKSIAAGIAEGMKQAGMETQDADLE